MKDNELLSQDDANNKGDSREPPLYWEEEGVDHEGKDELKVLLQQDWVAAERKAHQLLQERKCRDQSPPRHRR